MEMRRKKKMEKERKSGLREDDGPDGVVEVERDDGEEEGIKKGR